MESGKLKLIIISTKQQRNRVINHFPVKLHGSDTFPSDTVRNLMLMNKTAIECWNILKYEIESIIDKLILFP